MAPPSSCPASEGNFLSTAVSTNGFVAAFNACTSPKAVSERCSELGLTVEKVSQLLYEAGENISVELLGQCLGYHKEFGRELAQRYPSHFASFTGLDVVSALRIYLWRFRLPGEAAQIERIVEGFAKAYFMQNQPAKPAENESCVETIARGWYVRQPCTRMHDLCCIHCGAIEDLRACQGCDVVHFCQRCCKKAHYLGHAVGCSIGYGRACVHAREIAGLLGADGKLRYRQIGWQPAVAVVHHKEVHWEKGSPLKSEDAVMVLAYAIIMLSTNLHNANVKQKMEAHEFLWQNRGVNDGANFPGDFLLDIYTSIKQEELKVMSA